MIARCTGRQRVAGRLVIGRGDALPVLPRHQANPGSLTQRRRQQTLRQREVRGKHPTRKTTLAQQTDGWMALFTSHADWLQGCTSYTTRWPTSNRLSVWMRGRFALTDLSGDLHPWLLQSLADGAQRLRATPLSSSHELVRAA